MQVAEGKKTQLQLEDTVLHLLSTATGSLLDNVELINTLDQSKTTWEEVNESLKVAEETTRQIEVASAQYRPCSTRAAILYFVLNDLAGAGNAYTGRPLYVACLPNWYWTHSSDAHPSKITTLLTLPDVCFVCSHRCHVPVQLGCIQLPLPPQPQ